MTVFIILAIILSLILSVLFSPVVAQIGFESDFSLNITFLGFKVFDTEKTKKEKKQTEPQKTSKKNKKSNAKLNAKTTFAHLRKKYGFTGAVSKIMVFVRKVLSHIKGLLRYINIHKVKLDIVVASDDAAKTAIEYGIVCQAVYPTLSALTSMVNIKYKEINVKSDFETENCKFQFSAMVKLKIIYLLIAMVKIFLEYKNFVTETDENERKQS